MVEMFDTYILKTPPENAHRSVMDTVTVTAALVAQGVASPYSALDGLTIRQERIKGATLSEQMRDGLSEYGLATQMAMIMISLAKLHHADATKIDAPRHMAFRTADKRIKKASGTLRATATLLRGHLEARRPVEQPSCVIHGDFHGGNVIQARDTGAWWIIDLDDVCLGAAEADVANFAVHLATAFPRGPLDNAADLHVRLAQVARSYPAPLARKTLAWHAAASLLRRGLKFSIDRDRPQEGLMILSWGLALIQGAP
jgi:aminoglycoside phosphotransferase (APT) family kinase protein